MEDVVHRNHVCQERGLEGPLTLEGLEAYGKLALGQVISKNCSACNQFLVNRGIRTPWSAERRRVSSRVSVKGVVRTLQVEAHNGSKRDSRYPPRLAKEDGHVEECLGGRLQVESHCRGLWELLVLVAVFKGLLVLQEANLIPGYVGPVINRSTGPPHVPSPEGK